MILVDNGTYTHQDPVVLDSSQSGVSTNPITIRGVTNASGVASIIEMENPADAITLEDTSYINIEHLTIKDAVNGISAEGSTNISVFGVNVKSSSTGLRFDTCPSIFISNVSVAACSSYGIFTELSSPVHVYGSVMHSNPVGIYADNSSVSVSNSIITTWGSGNYGYHFLNDPGGSYNYNNYWMNNGALLARLQTFTNNVFKETLSRWTRDTGQDVESFSTDPLFVDAGSCNFRLHSEAGYSDGAGGFILSGETSPLIDGSNPAYDIGGETVPNGGIVNIGLHGGTAEASRTPTNAQLVALTLNDGGRAEGTVRLYWHAQGAATNHSVKIDFSADGGMSWAPVVFGVSTGFYDWDTTTVTNTVLGIWRVTSIVDGSIVDTTDELFAIRNGPINFYVNDVNRLDDVYSSDEGSASK